MELADTLVADFDVVELLDVLTDRCVEVFGVDAAGIVLVGTRATCGLDGVVERGDHVLDLFGLVAQEGPSLDCFRAGARW